VGVKALRAPARSLRGAAGVLLSVLVAMACGEPASDPPAVLELAGDTIQLERGVRVHEVQLRGDRVEPERVEARVGDVVRFIAADAQGHAVRFNVEAASNPAREFLDRTGQLAGPPMLAPGSEWVVSLEGAPPGSYPFICMRHDTHGVLVVE
jgi:plastocyanin